MANRKTNTRGQSRKVKRMLWWRGLLRFVMLPPVQYLILVVIIVTLLYWQSATLESWASNIASNTWELFGWGLLLIVIAIAALFGLIWQRKLSLLIHYWNQWLGGIACILAAWGILALRDLGGSFGSGIIGSLVVTAMV